MQRDSLLADARRQLETDSMIERLEAEVASLPPAADAAVQDYYRGHPDKFTTPERVKKWVRRPSTSSTALIA